MKLNLKEKPILTDEQIECNEIYQDEIEAFASTELEIFLDELDALGLAPSQSLEALHLVSQYGLFPKDQRPFRKFIHHVQIDDYDFAIAPGANLKGLTPEEIAWMLYRSNENKKMPFKLVLDLCKKVLKYFPESSEKLKSKGTNK